MVYVEHCNHISFHDVTLQNSPFWTLHPAGCNDVLISNIRVAIQVLGPERRIHPGFIWLPLDIANIHGIAALTSMITLTPGTVSAALSDDRRYLLVHVLHLDDPDELIRQIKSRYEAPLMEIFP